MPATRRQPHALGKRRRRPHRHGDTHPLTKAFLAKQPRLERRPA